MTTVPRVYEYSLRHRKLYCSIYVRLIIVCVYGDPQQDTTSSAHTIFPTRSAEYDRHARMYASHY